MLRNRKSVTPGCERWHKQQHSTCILIDRPHIDDGTRDDSGGRLV
jgi:hypothetical protein